MKKYFLLLLPLFFYGCGLQSNKTLTEEQKDQIIAEVKPVITQLLEFAYQVKIEDYLNLVDSIDFVNIMNGQVIDYKAFKEGNKQLWSGLEYQKITINTDKFMILTSESVIYTMQGNDEAKFKNGDILKIEPFAATLLIKKINGTWKIAYNHWSGLMQTIPVQPILPDKEK